MFIDDITELPVSQLPQYQNSIKLGDFNIHIEDLTDEDAVIFNDTITALGLEQHITGPIHVKGNTLGLIFIQLGNCFDIINTTLHGFVSDDCMVSVNISIKYPNETMKIRDRTKIPGPTLGQNFTPSEFNEGTTIDQTSSLFIMELLKALDATTPIKDITFTFIRDQRRVLKSHWRSWQKVQTTSPMANIHKGKEHLQQAINLP